MMELIKLHILCLAFFLANFESFKNYTNFFVLTETSSLLSNIWRCFEQSVSRPSHQVGPSKKPESKDDRCPPWERDLRIHVTGRTGFELFHSRHVLLGKCWQYKSDTVTMSSNAAQQFSTPLFWKWSKILDCKIHKIGWRINEKQLSIFFQFYCVFFSVII